MRAFADLFRQLDSTTKTTVKVAAMREYFRSAAPADAAWAMWFLSGRKLKRLVNSRLLREWAAEAAGVSSWLFEECYGTVGDLAETVALLLPPSESTSDQPLHHWVESRLRTLANLHDEEKHALLVEAWAELDQWERFVWNKLITGALRVGVSQKLVMRAIAQEFALDVAVVAHRMMGDWDATAEFWSGLIAEDEGETDHSRPYPFFLANPLETEPAELGEANEFLVEWKWDGIRAQLIRRNGETFIWSRGEELIGDRFPELHPDAEQLPDGTVLDGEILAWSGEHPLPFGELQRRIGRKTVGKKLLKDVPCVFLTFDMLEREGVDLRTATLRERRDLLVQMHQGLDSPQHIRLSVPLTSEDWSRLADQRETSREQHVEGLMLKRLDSEYGVGRPRGPWWKWKVAPLTIDAVMIYAQKGHGRRASLFTDYTFALWRGDELVPFAKAYSGLTDEEIKQVDKFVRKNTVERFGPVRSVKPELVFELAFENIQKSTRHKSGIAVRFPRMVRWRHDKQPKDADTLETIQGMLSE